MKRKQPIAVSEQELLQYIADTVGAEKTRFTPLFTWLKGRDHSMQWQTAATLLNRLVETGKLAKSEEENDKGGRKPLVNYQLTAAGAQDAGWSQSRIASAGLSNGRPKKPAAKGAIHAPRPAVAARQIPFSSIEELMAPVVAQFEESLHALRDQLTIEALAQTIHALLGHYPALRTRVLEKLKQ